jgi:hypothetical protein
MPQLEGVLHIPIVTNSAVTMHTRQKNNYNDVKSCHFASGNLWWFNSANHIEHSVENNSTEDRWHLWINAIIVDQNFNIVGTNLYNSLKNSTRF